MRSQLNTISRHSDNIPTDTILVNAYQTPSHFQIPVMTKSTSHENSRLATLIKKPNPVSLPNNKIVSKSTFDRNFRNTIDLLDFAKRLNEDAFVDLRIRKPRVVKKVVLAGVKAENSAEMVTRKGYRTITNDLQSRFESLRNDPGLYEELEQRVEKLTTKTTPKQDLVIRNVGVVGIADKNRIKAVAQRHKQHMNEVLERKKKLDKLDLKKRLRVIEDKDKRSEQAIANERDFGGSLKEVQERWFTVFYCASKVAKIKESLKSGHIEKVHRLKEKRSAIVIQRWYKSILNRARNLEVSNALAVISYHFKKYYQVWKLKRLQRASNIIQTFFKEVYDVSRLLKIVKKYRLSVIKSQKYSIDYLKCRDAKVKVIAKYWNSLELTWWTQRQKVKTTANGGPKDKKKAKKEEFVKLAEEIKTKIILEDLISRRKIYWKDLIEREKQVDPKSLIVAPSPSVKKEVPLLPRQEEIFAMMEVAFTTMKVVPK